MVLLNVFFKTEDVFEVKLWELCRTRRGQGLTQGQRQSQLTGSANGHPTASQ